MVNTGLMPGDVALDPEVSLAIGYVPASARRALTALWSFDARIAQILRTTTEPMIGQMRLTWWHDVVGRAEPIAGEPLLAELAASGLLGAGLQRVVEGWEELLQEPDDATLGAYADGRGGGLFTVAASVCGSEQDVRAAGAGWALVDLARHHTQATVRDRALALARERLAAAPVQWPRATRTIGLLAKLARRDLRGPEPQGSPRRLLAGVRLALTGR